MSKGFNLKNTTAGKSSIANATEKVKDIGLQKEFKYIDVTKIIPSDKNFYGLRDIDDLKESINEYGILQPLLVESIGNDSYNLIAGHRRLKASIEVGLESVPVYIKSGSNDVDFEIMLIHANKQREKNDMERATEIRKLKELIEMKKGNGEILQGRTMDIVADIAGTSRSQAHRLDKLNNLIPEIQTLISSGELPASTAENFSNMPEDMQYVIFEKLKEEGVKISRKEAAQIRADYEKKVKAAETKSETYQVLADEQKRTIKSLTQEKETLKAQLKSSHENMEEKEALQAQINELEKALQIADEKQQQLQQEEEKPPVKDNFEQKLISLAKQRTLIETCKQNCMSMTDNLKKLKQENLQHENTEEFEELKNIIKNLIDLI